MTESTQKKNQNFLEPSGALRSPHGTANHCLRDTTLDSFTMQPLLNSIMNKILANALQREKEGARNPQEGERGNKASLLREAKINKCIICIVI